MGRVDDKEPVRLLLQPHPFQPARRIAQVTAGSSVATLLGDHIDERHKSENGWVVRLNGRLIPPEDYDVLVPGPGDCVMARVVPRPPVLLAIAYYVSYGVSYALAYAGVSGSTAIAVGAIAGKAAYYAISMAVQFGISALLQKAFAPSLPSQARVGSSSPFYSVQGARNQTIPHGAIQQTYGCTRVVPDMLGPVQTTISDTGKGSARGRQTIRALFCVGHGHYELSEFRYGTQPLDLLNPVQVVVWNGLNAEPFEVVMKDFLANIFEEALNLELRNLARTGSEKFVRATQEDVSAFEVSVVFVSGMWRISDDARPQLASVRLIGEYRPAGGTDDDWVQFHFEGIKAHTYNKIVRNLHVDVPTPGQYEVRVYLEPNMSPGLYTIDRGGTGGSSAMTGDAVWVSLRSFLPGLPVSPEAAADLTIFGVEAMASELIQGQLDLISVKAQRLLPTYSLSPEGWSDVLLGETNQAAYTATSSPAWAFAEEHRDAGVPDDELDSAEILRFHEYCEAEDWTCDATQTDVKTLEDSVRTIASCGQGAPVMRASKFSIIWDEERTPIVAFGPFNMSSLQVEYPPAEDVHAVRVRFPDEAIDGKLREITVYLDGFDEDNAERFETLDLLIGLTTEERVTRHVRREHLKRRARRAVYTWEAPLEANVCEIGDVADLAYGGALLGEGQGQSRVTGYSTRGVSDEFIDEVFLHPAVRLEAGREYVLKMRRRAAGATGGYAMLTVTVVNPLTAGVQRLSALEVQGDVAVPTYTDDESVQHVDDLVDAPAFLGQPVSAEVIIFGVETMEHGRCRLIGADYAGEELFGG